MERTSPHIAVVGGGITGLTSAFYLLRAGMRVSIFEARSAVGGLAAAHDFGPFFWDRFYHCILTSDTSLLQLLEDLDLTNLLRWKKTEVGFYSQDRLHTMTSPFDLLKYPCLPLSAKVRFGLGILYASRIQDGEHLESVPLKEWILKVFGPVVYREMWEPLLRCKLGEMRSQASAAFLWATIRRLYSTRGKGVEKKEELGYVEGGYRVVMDRLVERIEAMGGTLHTGVCLSRLESVNGRIEIDADDAKQTFDSCLMTIPNRSIMASVPGLSEEYRERLESTQYLGMVCVALVLRHSLSPYYLTNLTQEAPFTGIVEMTNLISAEKETAGHHLVYLPKYTSPGDPLFQMDDRQVWERFSQALFKIHPRLRSTDIVSTHIFRERYVQPVPTLNYSSHIPGIETGIPHLFVANTSQIVNNTLNNNVMTEIARRACTVVGKDVLGLNPKADSVEKPPITTVREQILTSEVVRDTA